MGETLSQCFFSCLTSPLQICCNGETRNLQGHRGIRAGHCQLHGSRLLVAQPPRLGRREFETSSHSSLVLASVLRPPPCCHCERTWWPPPPGREPLDGSHHGLDNFASPGPSNTPKCICQDIVIGKLLGLFWKADLLFSPPSI